MKTWAPDGSERTLKTQENAMSSGSTDPNARGEDGSTALHHAVMGEGVGAVESLLAAGAEVDARDKNGWTPLHWAARHAEDPAVLGVLTRAGAQRGSCDPGSASRSRGRPQRGGYIRMDASSCGGGL